ncbi:GntR family transcriptional regulator [Kribbella sp. NPDC059898]|uniref:GntR family transcriptional regulator n=1 Tax=Kribbella sp. NPDC059898 TaxID=3346995 RepID=UPI0036600E41
MPVQDGQSLGARFRSLGHHAAEELREAIIDGDLAAGERLVERDLAGRLEVSRIVVRDALQQLTNEGLVELLPRRGGVVTALTAQDILDLVEVRASVEVLAARLAAVRRTDADLERLRSAIEDAAAAAVGLKDQRAAARANVAFHEELVRASGNALLESIVLGFSSRLRRMFQLTRRLDTDRMADHQALYDAVAAHDPDRAAEVAHHHILTTAADTLTAIGEPHDRLTAITTNL